MKRRPFLSLLAVAGLALGSVLTFAADGAKKSSKPSKPDRISQGSEVTLENYVIPGKVTVFDFTSDYCPPCRAIAPHLDKLHATREDVAVVKVDINRPGVKGIDWKSPVAQQYALRSIPHFKVFSADGKLAAEGDEAWAMVREWLE